MGLASQNIQIVQWQPKGVMAGGGGQKAGAAASGAQLNLSSVQNVSVQWNANTTMLQSDNARTILAYYRDAKHAIIRMNLFDDEYTANAPYFSDGQLGTLLTTEYLKAQGGDPEITPPSTNHKVVLRTFTSAGLIGVESGIPSQGNATVVLTFLGFDPAGQQIVTFTLT